MISDFLTHQMKRNFAGITSCPHCFATLFRGEAHDCKACQVCNSGREAVAVSDCCHLRVCKLCRVTIEGKLCCGASRCVQELGAEAIAEAVGR